MASSVDSVVDEIAYVAHAVADDTQLRSWFFGLQHLSPSARSAAFREMASRMVAGHERPATIAAVSALASRDIYSAVRDRVHELYEADRFTLPTARTTLLVTLLLGLVTLGICLLVRSLGDQSTFATIYFWPAIICLLAAATFMTGWLVSFLSTKFRKTRIPEATRTI